MKDDLKFLQLWDTYSPMLTATQREITDLYFNYDLSLGEIAEQKGVSRQSVSDCLNKCRKQLETYEEKLGFLKTLNAVANEYTAYATAVESWCEEVPGARTDITKEIEKFQASMEKVRQNFDAE